MNAEPLPLHPRPMSPVIVNVSLAACAPFPALLYRDKVLSLARWSLALPCAGLSMEALLAEWPRHGERLRGLCSDPATMAEIEREGIAAELLRFHAPVSPGQVYCTIGNYRCQLVEAALDAEDGPHGAGAESRRHAIEQTIEERRRHGEPYACLKGRACVAGPHDDLPIDASHASLDWEVEIGVVIGRPAWQVRAADALAHVAGCCVVNDITLRDRVFRRDVKALGTDWLQSKSHPGWLPAGPWLTPAWNIPNPQSLRLQLWLNGQLMQDGCSEDMLFTVAEQIAYLARHTRLEPGDLICTGSPAGFGSHHGRFLRPGDVLEARVEGLGTQRVHCVRTPVLPAGH